jgi:hypothetical protein
MVRSGGAAGRRVTEDGARAALRAFEAVADIEQWIAEQPWDRIPGGGWRVRGWLQVWRFRLEPVPGGVRVVMRVPGEAPAIRSCRPGEDERHSPRFRHAISPFPRSSMQHGGHRYMTRLRKLLPLCLALALAAPGTGMADPWKDESGKGRDRRERGWDHRGDRRDRDRWDDRRGWGYGYHPPPIPFGHLPPPGEYRLWIPDRPPGHQPPPHRW